MATSDQQHAVSWLRSQSGSQFVACFPGGVGLCMSVSDPWHEPVLPLGSIAAHTPGVEWSECPESDVPANVREVAARGLALWRSRFADAADYLGADL